MLGDDRSLVDIMCPCCQAAKYCGIDGMTLDGVKKWLTSGEDVLEEY